MVFDYDIINLAMRRLQAPQERTAIVALCDGSLQAVAACHHFLNTQQGFSNYRYIMYTRPRRGGSSMLCRECGALSMYGPFNIVGKRVSTLHAKYLLLARNSSWLSWWSDVLMLCPWMLHDAPDMWRHRAQVRMVHVALPRVVMASPYVFTDGELAAAYVAQHGLQQYVTHTRACDAGASGSLKRKACEDAAEKLRRQLMIEMMS